jgi:hypothetical protein
MVQAVRLAVASQVEASRTHVSQFRKQGAGLRLPTRLVQKVVRACDEVLGLAGASQTCQCTCSLLGACILSFEAVRVATQLLHIAFIGLCELFEAHGYIKQHWDDGSSRLH